MPTSHPMPSLYPLVLWDSEEYLWGLFESVIHNTISDQLPSLWPLQPMIKLHYRRMKKTPLSSNTQLSLEIMQRSIQSVKAARYTCCVSLLGALILLFQFFFFAFSLLSFKPRIVMRICACAIVWNYPRLWDLIRIVYNIRSFFSLRLISFIVVVAYT